MNTTQTLSLFNAEPVDLSDLERLSDELNQAMYDIPFENSNFQNLNFVVASQITPERSYRSLLLKMHSKLAALEELAHNRRKDAIDVLEMEERLASGDLNKYDRMRWEEDLAFKKRGDKFTAKLINDALCELSFLYDIFKKMPRYTREDFEKGEGDHFKKRLDRQNKGITGSTESLTNMTVDVQKLMVDTLGVEPPVSPQVPVTRVMYSVEHKQA